MTLAHWLILAAALAFALAIWLWRRARKREKVLKERLERAWEAQRWWQQKALQDQSRREMPTRLSGVWNRG